MQNRQHKLENLITGLVLILGKGQGTNENTNGLIRQFFPKKTCLAQYSQQELDKVAAQLNSRPRKTLKFKTPKEVIENGVALTS